MRKSIVFVNFWTIELLHNIIHGVIQLFSKLRLYSVIFFFASNFIESPPALLKKAFLPNLNRTRSRFPPINYVLLAPLSSYCKWTFQRGYACPVSFLKQAHTDALQLVFFTRCIIWAVFHYRFRVGALTKRARPFVYNRPKRKNINNQEADTKYKSTIKLTLTVTLNLLY